MVGRCKHLMLEIVIESYYRGSLNKRNKEEKKMNKLVITIHVLSYQ
jgi:hypothetical protein